MRFSVLTLNLHTWQESDQIGKFDRIARYVAEENFTCLCLQECGQRTTGEFLDNGETLRTGNAAYLLQSKLGAHGLKYSLVWGYSHDSFGSYEEGVAILTQLPVLGNCARYVSETTNPANVQARNVVMARLAVSPNAVIDVYSVHLSPPEAGLADQLDSLVDFVNETPSILEQMKPPAPKRRGPPRKRVPVEAPPVSTRLICLAGDMNDKPEGHVKVLSARGFLEASSRVREEAPDAGTFEDGRWIDYVFIKPALRPQAARVVFNGGDLAPVSDHYGVAVEFEV